MFNIWLDGYIRATHTAPRENRYVCFLVYHRISCVRNMLCFLLVFFISPVSHHTITCTYTWTHISTITINYNCSTNERLLFQYKNDVGYAVSIWCFHWCVVVYLFIVLNSGQLKITRSLPYIDNCITY